MEARIVTADEVKALHTFCKQHFVPYYDIRLELVDHLASSIEDIWQEKPETPFREALDRVYSRYGALGFRSLMREKEIQLEKSYQKGLKRMLRYFLHWPGALSVIAVVLFILLLSKIYLGGHETISILSCYFLLFLSLGYSGYAYFFLYRKRKSLQEPLFSTSNTGRFLIVTPSLLVPLLVGGIDFNSGRIALISLLSANYLSFLFLLLFLFADILLVTARISYVKSLYEKAREDYPRAFIA